MSASRGDDRGAGWVLFASMVMVVLGGWAIFEGLFAILDKTKFAAVTTGQGQGAFLVVNVTTWGWIHMLLGLLVVLTGVGLISGSGFARGFAVFLVTINAISQVLTIPVFPFWGITLLFVNIMVIWALCVYRPADIS